MRKLKMATMSGTKSPGQQNGQFYPKNCPCFEPLKQGLKPLPAGVRAF